MLCKRWAICLTEFSDNACNEVRFDLHYTGLHIELARDELLLRRVQSEQSSLSLRNLGQDLGIASADELLTHQLFAEIIEVLDLELDLLVDVEVDRRPLHRFLPHPPRDVRVWKVEEIRDLPEGLTLQTKVEDFPRARRCGVEVRHPRFR